jgi:hypothetical protein
MVRELMEPMAVTVTVRMVRELMEPMAVTVTAAKKRRMQTVRALARSRR